jgi:hypothetical protein
MSLKWSLFQLHFDLVILKFVGPPVVLPLNIPYTVYLERGPDFYWTLKTNTDKSYFPSFNRWSDFIKEQISMN